MHATIQQFGGVKASQQVEYQRNFTQVQRQRETKQKSTLQKLVDDGKQGLSFIQDSMAQVSSNLFSADGTKPGQPTSVQGNNHLPSHRGPVLGNGGVTNEQPSFHQIHWHICTRTAHTSESAI